MKSPSENHDNPNKLDQQKNVSPSKSDADITTLMNAALTSSVKGLPEQTITDIAQARKVALAQLQPTSKNSFATKRSLLEVMYSFLTAPLVKIGAPMALAVLITISFEPFKAESIPALPFGLMDLDMPNENLALLEELDFVTWLAQNEQTAFL
ncbi:MAG: hypothetical protein COB83_09680 [Gammaproteobacteria bacterium]|nr:MAG: hypothetical protein COB83_09680 [Gammaproteobacteria bacterium]